MQGKRTKKQKRKLPFAILSVLLLFALWGAYHHFAPEPPSVQDVPTSVRDAVEPPSQPVEKPKADDMVTKTEVIFTPSQEFSLTAGQQAAVEGFMKAWYTSIGGFTEPDFSGILVGDDDAKQHAAACRTLIAIRSRALEDLRLHSCRMEMTVTDVKTDGASGELRLYLDETAVMRFAGLDVDSELFALPHIFVLRETADDTWTITHHEADDNPYFSLRYEEDTDTDTRLPIFLRSIERRQLLRQEQTNVTLACDHPYDRDAALRYMTQYCGKRNEQWYAYDDVGGNCMNFGSQVLLAGGIPMDERGDDKWYWHSKNSLDVSFINVGKFLSYARDNEGYGLVADMDAGYYTGEVGDIIIFGVSEDPRHTTVICDVVRDKKGSVIDYLLCSNTTNYRNFPAGAYYYTGQRLVKIFGWNE